MVFIPWFQLNSELIDFHIDASDESQDRLSVGTDYGIAIGYLLNCEMLVECADDGFLDVRCGNPRDRSNRPRL